MKNLRYKLFTVLFLQQFKMVTNEHRLTFPSTQPKTDLPPKNRTNQMLQDVLKKSFEGISIKSIDNYR